MDNQLLSGLALCETDIEGARKRFCDDEGLYVTCLCAFIDDPTMEQLSEAIRAERWDDAFTAAHALKGLAGNMGFVPLFHAAAELVVLIRTNRLSGVVASYNEVRRCYDDVALVIRKYGGAVI